MKIIKAKILGYCMGVRRAVDNALAAAGHSKGKKIFTAGPLIHNPRVVEHLQSLGIDILDDENIPETLENSIVIIRAHGISPQLEVSLRKKQAEIIDATCPRVKANQLNAKKFSVEGYTVFLAGEKHHGEIIALMGYCHGCIVVENADKAAKAAKALSKEKPDALCVLIGQTTVSHDEYDAVGLVIQSYFPNLIIVDAICNATTERQEVLRELCGETDAVLIAGSKKSANTRRLLKIAVDLGKPAWLVEGREDIPSEISLYETVGISAGASTPEEVIREIVEGLNKFESVRERI